MMPCRLVTAFLFFATLFTTAPSLAQGRSEPRHGSSSDSLDPFGSSMGTGRITGTVRTFDGHAVDNATVDARESGPGNQHFTGRSDSSGSFALYNISPGTYEVTVSMGVNEARERVQVGSMSGDSNVDFRLANKSAGEPKAGNGSTISLSQYRVPAKARSLYEKAAQAMAQGKPDESRKKVDAALAIFPKFAEALTLRGVLQEKTGKLTEAIADYQRAIQCDPTYVVAYLTLASALNSTGRFSEAVPVLGQAERLTPNAWQTYFELARANIGKGEFATAIRNIDRASELQRGQQRDSPELHLVRGYALIGLTEIPKAIQELEAFLVRQPNGHLAEVARNVLAQLRESTTTANR